MDKGKGKARATNVSSVAASTGSRSAGNAIGTSTGTGTATGAGTTAAAGGGGGGRDGIEDSELTYNETIDAIVQFLEAAFHTILYIRGVYPPEIFKAHRLYSHPVYRSRHPGLNEYISTVLASIRSELQASRISQVLLVLKSSSTGVFLERYIFRLAYLLPSLRRADRDLAIRDNVTFRELESVFRGFLVKLAVCEGALEMVEDGEDVEFAVMLRAREGCRVGPQGEDLHVPDEGMWVPADRREGFFGGERSEEEEEEERQIGDGEIRARRRRGGDGEANDQDAVILPIKSLDSGVINLMLYIEDNPKSKASLRRSVRRRRTSRPYSAQRPPLREDQDQDRDIPLDREEDSVHPHGEHGELGEMDIEDLLLREDRGRGIGIGKELGDDVDGDVEVQEENEKRGTKRKGIARRSFSNSLSKPKTKSKTKNTSRSKSNSKSKPKGSTHTRTSSRTRTRPHSSLLLLQEEEEDQESLSNSSFSDSDSDSDSDLDLEGSQEEEGHHGERKEEERPSPSTSSPSSSPSSDERSDVSIISVGDFAGYGGVGPGAGAGAGGGMGGGW